MPSGFVPPVAPTYTTVPLDGSTLLGTAGPFTFASSGGPLRVHLHAVASLTLDTSVSNEARADLFLRIDGGDAVLCATTRVLTANANLREDRTLLCETLVEASAGEHTLAFELGYRWLAPTWQAESTSLVTVEELSERLP